MGGVLCCCPEDTNFDPEIFRDKANSRDVATHPSDSSIALTVHQPLYPPGRIIHIVRNHPKKEDQKYETKWRKLVKKHDPVYQALWADNVDFDEVLISPVMVQDHMPDKVLDALEKLLVNTGPAKPQRQLSEGDRRQLSNTGSIEMGSRTPPHRLVLETSFTDLQPDSEEVLCYGYQNRSNPNWDYNGVGVVIDESKENDVEKRDWMQMAPLASPETLSDVSSVSSKESNQKVINGNRISWGGVPPMDPIAQSPAVHRPNSDSLTVPMKKYDRRTMRVDSGTGLEENLTYPLCYKVVTEATVEMNAERESNCSPHLMDPSHLCLNIDSLDDDHVQYRSEDRSHFGADSTYASTSTEQTIERLFTPHEPKRVTFDLYESQKMAREVSEDSMYNSGESFVPTYPEYSTQQEYGSHGYMYTPCGYASFSPMSSPTMEHSISDVQLFKVSDTPSVHKSHFHEDILQTQEMAPIYEEPIVASSPRKHPRKGTIEVDLTPSMSPLKDRKEPPTESSL